MRPSTYPQHLRPRRGPRPRPQGLLAALELLRADAVRGALLDFRLLLRRQHDVLGTPQPPPFRDQPAVGKGGWERYGIGPDTRARLDALLDQSTKDGGRPLSLIARAARACLDLCRCIGTRRFRSGPVADCASRVQPVQLSSYSAGLWA